MIFNADCAEVIDIVVEYIQIRQKFRDRLQLYIDLASYCLLRQIERDTIRVDLKNTRYVQQLAPLVCCFWALIRMPISMKQIPEKDRQVACTFRVIIIEFRFAKVSPNFMPSLTHFIVHTIPNIFSLINEKLRFEKKWSNQNL